MKKIFIILFIGILFLSGCNKKVDYSEYSFTDTSWIRNADHDIETIRFNSDGSFSYYCGCGNSVNDSDLCDNYTYNDKTKEIKLDCFEKTDEMVTTIKIIKSSDSILELDFDGDIRIFEKTK